MEYQWFNTLEEFISWELRVNKGSHTTFTKDMLLGIYRELYQDEKLKSDVTKDYLVRGILMKKTLLDLYNEYKDEAFGIKPSKWIDKFNLSPSQRKRMEKEGYLLHVMYHNYEKVFTNTYAKVPYYRAEDYFNHTVEEVELWKEENIKGYKKRKELVK